MWNNVSSPLPLPSALPLLSYPPSSNLAVCGTQRIPTLHCSCAVRPNQRPDLYWFSATCARRLAAAKTPCSLPPLLSFPAPSPPPSPGATDAQCAVQSICHQLSAFSRAMMCGKNGEEGRGGREMEVWDVGAGGGGGRGPSNWMRTTSHHETPCNEDTSPPSANVCVCMHLPLCSSEYSCWKSWVSKSGRHTPFLNTLRVIKSTAVAFIHFTG